MDGRTFHARHYLLYCFQFFTSRLAVNECDPRLTKMWSARLPSSRLKYVFTYRCAFLTIFSGHPFLFFFGPFPFNWESPEQSGTLRSFEGNEGQSQNPNLMLKGVTSSVFKEKTSDCHKNT